MGNHESERPQLARGLPKPKELTEEASDRLRSAAKAWSEQFAERAADVKAVSADDLRARAR